MSTMKEKSMKRKLFGADNDDKLESTPGEKKRRRKNVEAPKHYPLSVRQQLAMVMQMTSAENSSEPASPPPSTLRRTPGGSGRKDKIHKRNERGETLLHLSTIRGDLDSMKELIKQGAEVNVQDFAGWTPLHEACNHGHHEITQYLLEVGANVNSRGLEDDTPLHDAVTNAHKDLVELLLKHGANPLLANKRGERPLDMAEDDEIKELLQKEVMSSDESEPASPLSVEEDEKLWESPTTKIDEIKSLHKKEPKSRTTSTCSSSSRELFKSTKKKQKTKEKSKSVLSVDSSSNTDDSDDEPLIQKRSTPSTPKTNNKQKPIGKTPTLNATPVSSLSKSKSSTKSSKSSKIKRNVSHTIRQNLLASSSSSSLSSDSEQETVKKNSSVKPKNNFVSSNQGENSKEKPSLTKENKSRPSKEKLNSSSVHPGKVSTPELIKRHKTYNIEDEVPSCKSKNKNPKLNEVKPKLSNFSSFSKTSKFSSFDALSSDNSRSQGDSLGITGSKMLKDETDESVYDFSLSTEDFTSVGDISLKHSTVSTSTTTKAKDKASELFDTLCLGKSNDDIPSYKDFSLLKRKSVECKRQELPHSLYGDFTRETQKNSNSNFSYESRDSALEKNSNTINLSKLQGSHAKPGPEEIKLDNKVHNVNLLTLTNASSMSLTEKASPPKIPSIATKTEEKVGDLSNMGSGSGLEEKLKPTTGLFNVIKTEVKVEKKFKEKKDVQQNIYSSSLQSKSSDNLEYSAETKQASVKKDLSKNEFVECVNDAIPKETMNVTQEKDVFEKEVKVASVKKKKKHKHSKSNHESPVKVKDRVSRTPSETSQPETANITEKDPTTPKQAGDKINQRSKLDSQKSGQVSRKNSAENKIETHSGFTTPQQAKKKLKAAESGDIEPKSTSKSSTPKSSRPGSEKQHAGNSGKKDKTKPKNIALLSDDSSFFLSELEKSSRQREIEKMKLKKKKKKLLQQQKLKSQKSIDAGSKDLGSCVTGIEKKISTDTQSYASDQKMEIQLQSESGEIDKGRGVYPQINPTPHQPSIPARDPNKHALYVPFPHPLTTQNISMPNVRQHDHMINESPTAQAHHYDVFKSPLANRSISQVDEHNSAQQIPWLPLPTEKLLYSSPEKLPVQRSLSFSGQPSQVGIMPSPSRNYPAISPQSNIDNKAVHESTMKHHTSSTPLLGDVHSFSAVSAQTHGYNPKEHSTVSITDPLMERKSTDASVVDATGTKDIPEVVSSVANLPEVSSSQINVSDVQTIDHINAASAPPILGPGKANTISSNEADGKYEEHKMLLIGEKDAKESNKDEEHKINTSEMENEAISEVKTDSQDEADIAEAKVEKDMLKDEQKLAVQKYIAERLSKVVIEEPKPQRLPVFIPMEKLKNVSKKDPILDHLNVYEEWAVIQKQINERRKKYAATVIPQAPQCYWEYMTFTGGYLLSGSRESWLSVPMLAPPPSLSEEMQALFVLQEKERVKLRLQHASQREKLIVSCEQEIMRVHSRAARTNQNQLIPLSACSVLLDREVYNVERRNKKASDGENGTSRTASIRDRFNARMFLSWLQDVDDKYEKMKNALLSRQRHEAQALHAVQRTEWLLKLQEVENQGQQRWTTAKPEDVTEVNVPLVNISDDFDLLPS